MKEYNIKITGKYNIIVLSPKMIAMLIEKIRSSDMKELVIPAEEILPQGYAQYLASVLEANMEIAKSLPNRSAYTLIAEQIKKLQFNEKDCFERVGVTKPNSSPQFDVDASEEFFIVTKQENSQFHYLFKSGNGEKIKSRTEVQGHRIFFSAGKTGMEECRCTGKMLCGVVHRDSEHRIVSATIPPTQNKWA